MFKSFQDILKDPSCPGIIESNIDRKGGEKIGLESKTNTDTDVHHTSFIHEGTMNTNPTFVHEGNPTHKAA